jgi:hypothetical protein
MIEEGGIVDQEVGLLNMIEEGGIVGLEALMVAEGIEMIGLEIEVTEGMTDLDQEIGGVIIPDPGRMTVEVEAHLETGLII